MQCGIHVPLLHRLERIVAALLSTVNGTTAWESLPSTLHVIKGVISMMAHNLNAQAGTLIDCILFDLLFCVYATVSAVWFITLFTLAIVPSVSACYFQCYCILLGADCLSPFSLEFIHSVQEPLLNLTMHLLQAVNSSTFNMADFFREFQTALQHTIEVAIQVVQSVTAKNTFVWHTWQREKSLMTTKACMTDCLQTYFCPCAV